MRHEVILCIAAMLLLQNSRLWADDLSNCAPIENAGERLACYDNLAGRPVPSESAESVKMAESVPFGVTPAHISPLDDRWDLTREARHPKFTLRPYKPVYLMPVVYTTDTNTRPCSEGGNPASCVANDIDLDDIEAKFQLSFKTKLAEDLFNGNGDIWAGYTQSSRWQVYNETLSAPFRETNYEPEIMMVFRGMDDVMGWKLSMLGFGLNHQSNGRNEPLSRSWNRIVAFAALQKSNWVIAAKPWYRLPEDDEDDNNPDIEDYVGRGEVVINLRADSHNFALTLRHSMNFDENRGSGLFEWTFPIHDYLKGYIQLFNGYGESLIDYNHEQTTAGAGITLVDW
jgi:phospholipase A1